MVPSKPAQRTFPKLNRHPDSEKIKKLIADGESPLEIVKMLTKEYPGNKKMWFTHKYLYDYRNVHHPVLAEEKRQTQYDYRSAKKAGKETTVNVPELDVATRIMVLTGQEPKPQVPRQEILNDRLLEWIEGNDGFIKFVGDMIIERGERVKLQDYQVEMSETFLKYDRVCICAGEQVGKDFMMQNFIIWWAITHAGSLQMVLCATQAQSSALKTRIEDKLSFSGDLQFAYAGSREKPIQIITFKNGSQALFLTARSQIAGYTNVDILWINEARFVKEEEIARVSPLLGIGGGKLLVLSRPLFRRGYFWDCYRNPAFKTMKLPTKMNKYFDKKVYEADYKTMPAHLFKADYMAEFADAGSSWFPEIYIDKCSAEDYDFKIMTREPGYVYSVGVDPARLADVSAIVVTGRNVKTGDFKVVHVHGFNPYSGEPAEFSVQYAYLQLLDRYLGLKYLSQNILVLAFHIQIDYGKSGEPGTPRQKLNHIKT